ncbi:MAG: hypothetical protein P8Z37_00685 [Acidobacteriota bacterium]
MEQNIREQEERQAEVQATLQEAGNQLSSIERALYESEESRSKVIEKLNTERTGWEQTRQDLEQKIHDIEEENASLRGTLTTTEEQRNTLEAALRESETNRTKTIESFDAERTGWEESRRNLEQKIHETEEQRTELQNRLHETEERRASLETALHDSEKNRSNAVEELNSERANWEESRRSLEQKIHEIEEQRTELQNRLHETEERRANLETALHESEANRTSAAEAFREERAGWEEARRGLEHKVHEVEEHHVSLQATLNTTEEQRMALEAALQQAEEEQARLLQENETEKAHLEEARREWEKRLRETEEQHATHLQYTIQSEEKKYQRLYEEYQANKSHLEEIKGQTGKLKADIENLQSELEDVQSRYQRISQVPSIGMVLSTSDGRVLESNEVAARMFGYSGAETALSQSDKEDIFCIPPFVGTLGSRLQSEGKLENIEWTLLNREGRLYRIRENAKLKSGLSGVPDRIERVFVDITEEYRLGEEIRRIRKVESTGNALTSAVKILENLNESLARCGERLKNFSGDSETVQQVADTLLKDASRSSKHAHQLLTVSTKTDRASDVVDLNEILSENEEVLHSLVGEDIELEMKPESGMSLISADRSETVQLILNMAVSSIKNLPLGGSLQIGTGNVEIDASESDSSRKIPSGMYTVLTIGVDGCGVTMEPPARFNQMIVNRMGGWIETANDPSSGNVHEIYFPRVVSTAGKKIPTPKISKD